MVKIHFHTLHDTSGITYNERRKEAFFFNIGTLSDCLQLRVDKMDNGPLAATPSTERR